MVDPVPKPSRRLGTLSLLLAERVLCCPRITFILTLAWPQSPARLGPDPRARAHLGLTPTGQMLPQQLGLQLPLRGLGLQRLDEVPLLLRRPGGPSGCVACRGARFVACGGRAGPKRGLHGSGSAGEDKGVRGQSPRVLPASRPPATPSTHSPPRSPHPRPPRTLRRNPGSAAGAAERASAALRPCRTDMTSQQDLQSRRRDGEPGGAGEREVKKCIVGSVVFSPGLRLPSAIAGLGTFRFQDQGPVRPEAEVAVGSSALSARERCGRYGMTCGPAPGPGHHGSCSPRPATDFGRRFWVLGF